MNNTTERATEFNWVLQLIHARCPSSFVNAMFEKSFRKETKKVITFLTKCLCYLFQK